MSNVSTPVRTCTQIRLTLHWYSSFQALTRFKVRVQISLIALPARCTPLRKARLHLDASRVDGSCRDYHRHKGSYAPSAPSCLNSLTPDAPAEQGRSTSAEVARCPSFPASTFG